MLENLLASLRGVGGNGLVVFILVQHVSVDSNHSLVQLGGAPLWVFLLEIERKERKEIRSKEKEKERKRRKSAGSDRRPGNKSKNEKEGMKVELASERDPRRLRTE